MALTKYETREHGKAATHKPLSSKHIFKLAYALALPGRFQRDLARFMKCAYLYEEKQKSTTNDINKYARGFHEACLLAQGFYQIESDYVEDVDDDDDDDDKTWDKTWDTLPARIDRVWTATRMFLMRGLVSMGDGNGNIVDCVEAVPNPATHVCVDVPEYDDDKERALHPDMLAHDLPSLLPRWNRMALPQGKGDLSYSTAFLWACAGCTLGTHCISVPEWHHRDRRTRQAGLPTLETVTAKVASVVRRLQFNERQQKLLEEKGATREQCAVYMRHRRLWVPYPGPLSLVPGPAGQSSSLVEATVTDLYRLLASKDRELRLLQRVVGKPWMVAPGIRSRVEAEAKAEATKGKGQ